MRVAFTWYGPGDTAEHTQWFENVPQVPAVGDAVSVGDPYVPTMTVRRVTWCADVDEGRRVGADHSIDASIDCGWHAEIWLSGRPE